ncbi:MAG: phosphoribosylglycinamide formyltransferase [Planctomycetota bacterium]
MRKLKLIALISGGGRTVLNIQNIIDAGKLEAEIDLVVSSRDDAAGIGRCREAGIDTAIVPSRDFFSGGRPDWKAMSDSLNSIVLPRKPDLVILAGFMCFYHVPDELSGKIMNIHPALIPSFCGKGMWGHHVHQAVAENGVKITGCTVHFVNNEYDKGPVILQKVCPVCDTDTPDDIAARVFGLECEAYPEAIKLFAEDRLSISGNIVKVRS